MSQVSQENDIEEDEFHYMVDVIFLVENRLFKAPRRYFEEDSEIFRTMFQLPIPENVVPDGSSKENPLRLVGIEKNDFQQLLRVMYPKEESLTLSEWTSVLKLSTMWQFGEIRKLSIRKMSQFAIDPVDKIVIARDYRVMEWFTNSLNDLARRKEPLELHDVDRLGWDYALKIAKVRESFTTCQVPSYTCTNPHCRITLSGHYFGTRETHSFVDVIKRVFSGDMEAP